MTDRPRATHSLTPRCDSSTPRPSTCLSVLQQFEQHAVAAADIEHPGAGRDEVGDDLEVDALGGTLTLMAPPSPRARAAEREEAVDGGEQFRLVEQEGVVAAVGLDLDEGDRGAGGVQRMHDRAALLGREQPVAGEGDQAEARLRAGEGVGQPAAMVGGEVEIIHRAGHVEIGIGVEAVDEGHALVAQIALDLEVGVEAEGQRCRGPADCGRTCGAAPLSDR